MWQLHISIVVVLVIKLTRLSVMWLCVSRTKFTRQNITEIKEMFIPTLHPFGAHFEIGLCFVIALHSYLYLYKIKCTFT